MKERVHFGWFIRRRRVSRGDTIRAVATRAKVSEPTVIAWEKLETPSTIYESNYGKLAAALGWTPDELDEWEKTKVSPPRESRRPSGASGFAKIRQEMKTRAAAVGVSEKKLYGALLELYDRLSPEDRERVLADVPATDLVAVQLAEGAAVGRVPSSAHPAASRRGRPRKRVR